VNLSPDGQEWVQWRNWIRRETGISLEEHKKYLIETRLSDLAQELDCPTFGALYARVLNKPEIVQKVIDRITTGETSFFRDSRLFELLKYKLLPDLIDARRRSGYDPVPLRVWSVACSTGQEVYSIAMTILETIEDPERYQIRLQATDISDQAISRASRGVYSELDVSRGLTDALRNKYFTAQGPDYKVSDQVRSLVSFRRENLLDGQPALGSWDIIFCRNVVIYFEDSERKVVFDKLGSALAPDGVLVVGSSESVTDCSPQFKMNRLHQAPFYTL
jgi:chemotaxis protein methyltransferase CheR